MEILCLAILVSGATDASLSDLVESGEPERIAADLEFTEGPVWHPDGYLLFSDIPANAIYKWSPDGKLEKFRSPSGNSNGLAVDVQGRLVACEHGNRRVSRTESDGTIVALADRYQGKRLNSPNDVAAMSDGSLYFTDPPYGVQPEQRELDFQGVYRIGPDGTLTLLADNFERPNGLAFSPDERILYVADTARRHVRAFDVESDGTLSNDRVFADQISQRDHGPDGMKLDANGNLYIAAGSIWIFSKTGEHIGNIATPEAPANCAFGGPESKTLFITARPSVYRVRLKVPGARVAGK